MMKKDLAKRRAGRPKRSDEQTLDTRTRSLEMAEKLLEEKGFAATSMDDVAKAVGVTKATLYHHFASKDALVVATFHHILDRERQDTKNIAASGESAKEQLVAIAKQSFSQQENTHRILKIVQDVQRFLPEKDWFELFGRFMAESNSPLEAILKRGIEQGEFRDHDTAFSSLALMGLLSQFSEFPTGESVQHNVEQFIELVMHGIGKQT